MLLYRCETWTLRKLNLPQKCSFGEERREQVGRRETQITQFWSTKEFLHHVFICQHEEVSRTASNVAATTFNDLERDVQTNEEIMFLNLKVNFVKYLMTSYHYLAVLVCLKRFLCL